jgi:hypothetical protein
MKRIITPLALAAALFCAAGARAQGQAPNAPPDTTVAPEKGQAPKTKEQKKMQWENGVKADCSAEIAAGGVCDGKDFGSGLEKCLQQNRKKLSDGCKAAVHPRKKMKKGAKAEGTEKAPAATPEKIPGSTPPQTPPSTPAE